MRSTLSLYQLAERQNIPVEHLPAPETISFCIQSETGRCYIGMDNSAVKAERTERVHLAHELGHCITGSFYNRYAARDIRQKQENRADKWAIRRLIPKDKLDDAVAAGFTEMWELADYFGVTEDFMRKAVCLYVHGNLNTELYF